MQVSYRKAHAYFTLIVRIGSRCFPTNAHSRLFMALRRAFILKGLQTHTDTMAGVCHFTSPIPLRKSPIPYPPACFLRRHSSFPPSWAVWRPKDTIATAGRPLRTPQVFASTRQVYEPLYRSLDGHISRSRSQQFSTNKSKGSEPEYLIALNRKANGHDSPAKKSPESQHQFENCNGNGNGYSNGNHLHQPLDRPAARIHSHS
eukprot:839925-Amorphochlora_amoeboformis.AAC.1